MVDRRIQFEIDRDTSGDRVHAWERLIEEHFFGVECHDADGDLRASVEARSLDSGSVTHMRYSSQTLTRRASMIGAQAEERIIIAAYQGGAIRWQQDQHDECLGPDHITIHDVSRPFRSVVPEWVETCAIQVPKASLVRRLGPIDTLVLGPLVPLQKMVSTFLGGLPDWIDKVDTETANRLIDQALDLIALMIGNLKGKKIEPSTHRAAMLLRLKSYIRAHLKDEELTVARTASALRISSRYVQVLMATEDTSFGRYVLAERLANTRRDILDSRLFNRQVTEVALDWGFKNSAHFSRSFKTKYGMSPRDAKKIHVMKSKT